MTPDSLDVERTTPSGIPIRPCLQCGGTHPITRRHCTRCGRASLFIRPDGACLHCDERQARGDTQS